MVGYDNSYLARTGYIGLTTVDNNYADMGRLAAHQLGAPHRHPRRCPQRHAARSDPAHPQDIRTPARRQIAVERWSAPPNSWNRAFRRP